MINVVFLLLIFFLLSAQIAPPAPAAITPPSAAGDPDGTDAPRLYITAEGTPHYLSLVGSQAIEAILATPSDAIIVAADRDLSATALVTILSQINPTGRTQIKMVLSPVPAGP